MEEFLVLLVQFVIEVLLESLGSAPWDWISYRWDKKDSGFGLGVLALVVGAVLGGISLLVVPHTMLHHSWSRLGNLISAPLLSGGFAWWIAVSRVERGREVPVARHFWHSFWFTFGLTVIRFAYAARA